jgi:hypothetical protein
LLLKTRWLLLAAVAQAAMLQLLQAALQEAQALREMQQQCSLDLVGVLQLWEALELLVVVG